MQTTLSHPKPAKPAADPVRYILVPALRHELKGAVCINGIWYISVRA